MEGPQFVFLLLPSVGGAIAGWLARHWTLAGAILAGSLGCIFLVPIIGGDARFATPLFSGAAVAAFVLLPLLAVRPDVNVWTRATVAMLTAFISHLFFLQYVMANI